MPGRDGVGIHSTAPSSARVLLESLFSAAVRAADAELATRQAVAVLGPVGGPVWVVAVGKAAHAMCAGAAQALRARDLSLAGGAIVAFDPPLDAIPALESLKGEHPVPGEGSRHAAIRLGEVVAGIPTGADVLVLLSGGTTSLIAGPVDAVRFADLQTLFNLLLASGEDIATMNAVRKRVLRWGAGRLAVALSGVRTHCLIVSDVPGNDPAHIGSGPCTPDLLTADGLLTLLAERQLEPVLPSSVRDYLRRVAAGTEAETPKPGDAVFARTTVSVILDNGDALRGAERAATAAAITAVRVEPAALRGDAGAAGAMVAGELVRAREHLRGQSLGTRPRVLAIWGGETTVRLGPSPTAPGGRCQELALACAGALHRAGSAAQGISVLAAGTDGRDGPTDAAGAVIDATTWSRIAERGRDPATDLGTHASYASLDAVGALLRTGLTGTNVNDVVLGLVEGLKGD
jgi:glycerate 2-kinase